MSFDVNVAAEYDRWYQKPQGQYADALERELFQRLVQPQPGQCLLEVGCGTGHQLEFFEDLGLDATGIDLSNPMLQIAAKKLGHGAKLFQGQANSLAFNDNSFDIVALINVLEFLTNPTEALKEAARVSQKKIYIAVLNKASFLGISYIARGKLRKSSYNQFKPYTIWEMEEMVRRALDGASLTWESVLFFPLAWHRYCCKIDRILSFKRNPFGAFLGICLTKY